jgi:type III pantothenate kinase
MLYTFDIGNTNIKLASFDNDKLIDFIIAEDFKNLSKVITREKDTAIAFCSVVPEKSNYIKELAKRDFNIEPFEVKLGSFANIKVMYETPNTLGLDRICSLQGAISLSTNLPEEQKFKENSFILTIDFGTATTINFLSYPNNFIGGIICPGIHTMINSLNKGTAQLPAADINDYKGLIGTSTNSSISSGIINATVGLIDKTIAHLKNDKKVDNLLIYVTGGNAKLLIPFLKFNFIYEKALVNYGIKNILSRNVT